MDSTIVAWLVGGACILLNLAVTTVLTILIKRWFAAHDEKENKRRKEHDELMALQKAEEQRKDSQHYGSQNTADSFHVYPSKKAESSATVLKYSRELRRMKRSISGISFDQPTAAKSTPQASAMSKPGLRSSIISISDAASS